MAKVKHRADAQEQIDAYIGSLPAWSNAICQRLRTIILKSDPKMIEDWKWGPNYYKDGMVCGYAAFQKHVNFVFFRGTLMKDRKKLFAPDTGNVQTRHIRITDVKEIDEDVYLNYLVEAISINEKGMKPAAKDKTVVVPPDVKTAMKKAGVLAYYETRTYTHRKTWMHWIEAAKKKETRLSRIGRLVEKLEEKKSAFQRNK